MPLAKKRRSPLDRFTDASPTAISAGFSAAMSIGPQPKPIRGRKAESGSFAQSPGEDDLPSSSSAFLGNETQSGTQWLKSLRHASGIAGADDNEGSGGEEGSDGDSPVIAPKGKKGRKKANAEPPAAKAAADMDEEEAAVHRKAQNRIAQREFRQRKQQYIRALEARVELLSSDHDTQVDRLRYALRSLLAENNTLRKILGSLARFIGEGGLGGTLQQNGISRDELYEIVNGRSEKTMTDMWRDWPGAKECEALRQIREEANIPVEGLPDMRTSPGPASGRRGKRKADPPADAGNSSNSAARPNAVAASSHSGGLGPLNNNSNSNGGTSTWAQPATLPRSNGTSTGTIADTPSSFTSSAMTPAPMTPSALGSFLNQSFNMMPTNFSSFSGGDVADNALIASLFGPDSLVTSGFTFNDPSGYVPPNSTGGGQLGGPSATMPMDSAFSNPTSALNMPTFNPAQTSSTFPSLSDFPLAQELINRLRSLRDATDVQPLAKVSQHMQLSQQIFFAHRMKNGAAPHPDDFDREKAEESIRLLHSACAQMAWHIANYRRDASYHLPPILRPTDLQHSRPHDPVIDIVPFAHLRDALILNHERLSIDEVMFALLSLLAVTDGDIANPETWMVDQMFMDRYPMLSTPDIVAATARWRKKFGAGGIAFGPGGEDAGMAGTKGEGKGRGTKSSSERDQQTSTPRSTSIGRGSVSK